MSAPEPLELEPGEIVTVWSQVEPLGAEWEVRTQDAWQSVPDFVAARSRMPTEGNLCIVRPRKVMVSVDAVDLQRLIDFAAQETSHFDGPSCPVCASMTAARTAIAEVSS